MQPIKIRLWAIVATISAVLLLGGAPDTATSQAACTVGTPTAFSYSGSPVAIPDASDLSGNNPGAQVAAPLTVSGLVGTVYDVNVSIDGTVCSATAGSTTVGLNHTFVNDLVIALQSPDGTVVTVINHTDGGGNNFCQTVLDDESAGPSIQSVVTANAPFIGSFTPNAALSTFDGETANGTWSLLAQDFFAQDTGSIRAWTVTITPATCPVATSRPIPTLGEWALLLFSALFAGLVWWRERLGRQQPNPS